MDRKLHKSIQATLYHSFFSHHALIAVSIHDTVLHQVAFEGVFEMKCTMTKRPIIDTNPDVDDAHALLLALSHPFVRVEAIATVAGNVSLEKTARNALAGLDLIGKRGPVYP